MTHRIVKSQDLCLTWTFFFIEAVVGFVVLHQTAVQYIKSCFGLCSGCDVILRLRVKNLIIASLLRPGGECMCVKPAHCNFAFDFLLSLLNSQDKQKLIGNHGTFLSGLHWRWLALLHSGVRRLYSSTGSSAGPIENRRCCEGCLIGDTCWQELSGVKDVFPLVDETFDFFHPFPKATASVLQEVLDNNISLSRHKRQSTGVILSAVHVSI